MQNVLLHYCRQRSRIPIEKVAARAGIPLDRYRQLEAGEALMSTGESERLGILFKISPELLWQSSAQLESLAVARELVLVQRERIKSLECRVMSLE